MKKILFLMMGAALMVSCGNSKEKMKQLARENLELSMDYPKQLKVLAVSEPDSAFGTGYFTKDEVKGMLRTMKVVTDTIMKRTGNMSRFNPEDHYVVSLAERQMRSMADIRSLIMQGDKKGEFSGWKVRIDYQCVDAAGLPYRSERWCFIDKEGKQVYKSFELPIPTMETLNLTWVNLLKKHYLCLLSYYQEEPERLENLKVKKAYDALLSVKNVEEFHQWRSLLKDYDLSFTEGDDIVSSNKMLAVLDDYAEGANDWILDSFIRWKLSFNPEKWLEVESWNCELVEILLKATQREEDVHIVIFPCGKSDTKRWAAIGQDANRLFEIFGWQTGYVETANEPVSWMFINKYGLEVLRQSGYSIQIRDFGEFDILSTAVIPAIGSSLMEISATTTTEMCMLFKKERSPSYWLKARIGGWISLHDL